MQADQSHNTLKKQARAAFLQGHLLQAKTLYQHFLEDADDMGALLHLAICCEFAGEHQRAKQLYADYGSRAGGSDALKETVRGRALFHQHCPRTPSVSTTIEPASTVTMSRLPGWGRFGNQLLEYFYLHTHARNHGLRLALPYWLGRDLFGLGDATLLNNQGFKQQSEKELDLPKALNSNGPSLAGVDLKGFCQIHTQYYAPYRDCFRALFRPIAALEESLNQFLASVRQPGKKLVAAHLRRTDYVGSKYDIGGIAWLRAWLETRNLSPTNSIVYIASDDPHAVLEFSEYQAVSMADFGLSIPGAEFLPDWWLLAHAQELAIANSTFSLTAAMLNRCATLFVRPNLRSGAYTEFDPWNTQVLDERG